MGWTELHAAGFNAWGQALFKPRSRVREEQKDLAVFTRVLSGWTNDFRDVESYLSYTLGECFNGWTMVPLFTSVTVTTTTETLIGGTIPPEQKILHTLPKRASYRLIAEAANGKVTGMPSSPPARRVPAKLRLSLGPRGQPPNVRLGEKVLPERERLLDHSWIL
jgi:hypothetical protein